MRRRISIWGRVRPSVRLSVCPSRVLFRRWKVRVLGASCAVYPALFFYIKSGKPVHFLGLPSTVTFAQRIQIFFTPNVFSHLLFEFSFFSLFCRFLCIFSPFFSWQIPWFLTRFSLVLTCFCHFSHSLLSAHISLFLSRFFCFPRWIFFFYYRPIGDFFAAKVD